MNELLKVRIKSLYYPELTDPVLRDISLEFKPGEFVFLTGSPRSGKSSLCQAMAGVIPSFTDGKLIGEIKFDNQDISALRLPDMAGKIGLVREEYENQLFCATVEEDLAFGPCNICLKPDEIRARIKKTLDFVGLSDYQKRKPETLSGGEAQRIALASVLTLDPEVIILDGAVTQLDPEGKKEIYEKLHALVTQEKKTVIIVEEKVHNYLYLAHRLISIDNGKVIYDGLPKKERLSMARIELDSSERIRMPVSLNTKGPNISVNNLSFQYQNGEFALKNVSLDIFPGEFIALMGRNGAGKTTLAKHFNGLHRPLEGNVTVNGMDTRDYSTAQLARYVGYLFQNPQIQICTNSVEAETAFALKAKKLPKKEIENKVSSILDKMGLIKYAQEHPYKLAKGDVQKLALASSLVTEPKILVIDEPTSQMSTLESLEIMSLISQYNRSGVTVIMISHDLKLALNFSTRMVVMNRGQIVLDIPTAFCFEHEEELLGLGLNIREVYAEGEMRYEAVIGV